MGVVPRRADVNRSARPPVVLIVEDDAGTRDLLAMALRDDGFAVEAAEDGRAALALLEGVRPDLILLDLRMAGMDGRAFARAYRAGPGPHAPILLTSTTPNPAPAATEIRAVGYLVKPFDIEELLAAVDAALGR